MRLSREAEAFQDRLGYRFKNPDLLIEALTHPSVSTSARPSNQRLEFLGDRVLNLIVAEALLDADPDAPEGVIAPRYNAIVRKESCAAVAEEIGLGAVLRLGAGELKTGGRRKNATLADALEALVAAIYLDGGYAKAKSVLVRLLRGRIENVEADAKDAKTALQEWAQARGQTPPVYREISREGPAHALVFKVEAVLQSGERATAEARAKRQAEQEAAKALLDRVAE